MLRIVGIEAHLMRAGVEQVLAMPSSIRSSATKLVRFKKCERKAGRRVTSELRGDGTSAKTSADYGNVELDHRGCRLSYAGSTSSYVPNAASQRLVASS